MARREQTLANSLNNELRTGMASTQAFAHVPPMSDREKLAGMVQRLNLEKNQNWGPDAFPKDSPTQSFKRSRTKAYEVPKTMSMQMPAAQTAVDTPVAQTAQNPVSPVNLKGPRHARNSAPRHSGKAIHTTMELMHLLGEHAGANKEIIKQNVTG